MPAYVYVLLLHGVLGFIDIVVNHELLFISLGVLITMIGYALIWWHAAQTGIVRVDHGWASWVLTAMSVLSLVWAIRDGVAAGRRAPVRPLNGA